ncbi:MAG: MBL fold metallo-hydrolase [Alphaproteobacteria bacterium]|nr:MBL fold metallo-hydrolase [Alphaproteobacteria bacterium]
MKTLAIGDVRIDRVVESEMPIFEPEFLFPDATRDALNAQRHWLEPHFVDAISGKLIMSFHTYIVRTPHHTILVDTCVGNDKHRPARDFWHHLSNPYLEDLARLGIAPEAVDYVMCTHLHVDHVGWNTRLVDGRWVPTFPNARYIFAREEYAFWQAKTAAGEEVNHGSFDDSVLPIVEHGQAVMVESDHALEDHIWLAPAPGHTPGNIVVNIEGGGDSALLCGDTIHHAAQMTYPAWSSRFCDDPVLSRHTRTALIERLADTPTYLLAAHFPTPVAGHIVRHGDAFRFKPRG